METNLPIYGLACPDTEQVQETKKKCGCMKKQAPQTLVHGIVINGTTKKPFEAGLVNVYNTRTKKGTTTNKDGSFSLYATPNDVLQISFVGYQTIQIKASKLPANIELQEKAETIQEVVITAGKKKKSNYLYAGLGLLGLLFVYGIAKDENKKNKKVTV